MTIDINELREAIQTFGSQAINEGDLNELLDRLELTESREAIYKKAFEISENTSRDLTEKVIPNIRDQLEAKEKEVAHIKEVEFPRKALAVTVGWKTKCARLEQERDALRTEVDKLKVEIAVYIKALLVVADWGNAWGPFPETNEDWRAMAIVAAREATKSFKHGVN